jgi:hypothetical protein
MRGTRPASRLHTRSSLLHIASFFCVLCPPASAHVISMSTGYATVAGSRVEYILRMPQYEMAHVKNPNDLLDHIRFSSGFESGRRTGGECHADPSTQTYLCAANFEFPRPVERLGVECTFYDVTVPNHIHMLHAERNGKYEQSILDSSFPSANMAFRPPTALETAAEQSGAGARRVWTNSVQLLLLVALAIAARSRRELAAVGTAFVAGECAGTVLILRSAWQPSPRFAEAAAALALAYLALEIMVFPKSGGRWLLALVFGAFEGMYFSIFLSESGYRSSYVLAGAVVAAMLVLLLAAVAGYGVMRTRLPDRYRMLLSRGAASVLLIAGSVWFFVRLRG